MMKLSVSVVMLHSTLSVLKLSRKLSLTLISGSLVLASASVGMTQSDTFGNVPLSTSQPLPAPLTPVVDFNNTSSNTAPIPVISEFEFQRPQNQYTYPTNTGATYRVEVQSESQLVLQQVRQVEPTAFIRRGEGIIQVGLFQDALNAQNMIQRLSSQGITANIVQISGNTNPGGLSPVNPIYGEIENQGYLVIIPGDINALYTIAGRVRQSGVPDNAVRLRSSPLGPHVAIGPFSKRNDAERWNSYLRSTGLDARVYFGH